ncbi:hypothetical protein C7N43_31170 [Sphingobacteriales bacterium UPWRP_1]|nr:hypothetical protein B6N25_17375 [Sphingobacteriales bacterium TSM_CSS]PSJ73043.1 hypothetical protein C7N43_31170 [Sphingobacteriales bacterium UPWRP_1]
MPPAKALHQQIKPLCVQRRLILYANRYCLVLLFALLKISVQKIGMKGDQKAVQQTPDKS